MPRRKNKRAPYQQTLLFITDTSLRQKIRNAVEISSVLYLKRNEKDSSVFAKEFCRLEILYAASVIEAVLLHLFKRRGESMPRTVYNDVYTLPDSYQSNSSHRLVLAKQGNVPRTDREIELDKLIEFFSANGILGIRLRKKVDAARRIRNTFHLAKSRKGIRCGPGSVNSAYDAVIEVLSLARTHLRPMAHSASAR